MTTIGINGFGRMGRLALRAAWEGRTSSSSTSTSCRATPRPPRTCSTFDSVHGRWDHDVARRRRARSTIDGTTLTLQRRTPTPGDVPWDELGVDVVLECTGQVPHAASARSPTSSAACGRSIVAAPVKDDGALNVVIGVNDDLLRPGRAPPRSPRPRARRTASRRSSRSIHEGIGIAHGVDHDAPRHHEHADDRRRAAQGPAPRARGEPVADPDDDRLGDRDRR